MTFWEWADKHPVIMVAGMMMTFFTLWEWAPTIRFNWTRKP
jgi:hypothetical protein